MSQALRKRSSTARSLAAMKNEINTGIENAI
jgi:hypothetical protein